ncbi:MmgE/PrpD family protein [Cupriavidus necator]|uniref:MmgE/PrpD family protein n=1 Tax=Cupriavidus necator TaxID=106590 RepID=A0A367P7X8_CUPNE|nr:MmgE/PrpD family protein [Cupriavidus necator]QQX85584.1 MmgE/PrpD family protein [Cupriavidus necator]RCJ03951.1 MmgE/PrpD family protein [Cupriavidus necator]
MHASTPSTGLAGADISRQAARFAVDRALRFPEQALGVARLSVYDFFAVALAGAGEPVSQAVRGMVRGEAGAPQASAFGMTERVPARAAALLNGAASHALDYDDTHFDFVGHPTVAVLPAALAVAERQQADGKALLEAFLTGVEVTCRVGGWLGRPHYNAGFHQTATSGAFGATAASARLFGLDAVQAGYALGLAATRASGLKCQFGTMSKPFHAGMAASSGVEAATLAALGFISRPDAIECAGGFAATHGVREGGVAAPFYGLPDIFRFAEVQYKFHACCHGTHPALEALLALRADHALHARDIEQVTLRISPQWLPVCCIERPRTGLEAKFSLSLTAAMVLAGIDTAALDSFTDARCEDPMLLDLARRVVIETDPAIADTACHARVNTRASAVHTTHVELSAPMPHARKAAKLRAKAAALVGAAKAEALWALVEELDALPAAALYPRIHAFMAGTSA